jgi:hypothetical protein
MRLYILEGHVPRATADVLEWARWFEATAPQERCVGNDVVGLVHIATHFIGLNYQFQSGPPLLFETMVFGGLLNHEGRRCATWQEAERQHAAMLARVLATVGGST